MLWAKDITLEFEAILFDFDGVLVDSEPIHWACWTEALRPLGFDLEWNFYRDHCIGIDDREMLRMMAARANPPRDWEDLWSLYPAKRELFRARTMQAPPFAAGLGAFLEQLHKQYKLGVVSSSSRAEIEPLLTAGGLREHFDAVVGGGDVKRHKPSPEPYLLAAEQLAVRTALVVEDSAAGVASGRAAGFEVLAVSQAADVEELVMRRLSRHAV